MKTDKLHLHKSKRVITRDYYFYGDISDDYIRSGLLTAKELADKLTDAALTNWELRDNGFTIPADRKIYLVKAINKAINEIIRMESDRE